MVFIIGGTLAIFFEFLLLSKKNKSLADKILTFWMLIISVHLYLYELRILNIDFIYPHLLGFFYPLPFFHGPLLFLYTCSLTGYIQKWKAKYLFNFLPVLVFFVYYFSFFFLTGTEKVNFIKQQLDNPDVFIIMLSYAIFLSGFTYIIITFYIYSQHSKNILNNLSNTTSKNNLHWIRNLLIGMLIIWFVALFGSILFPSDHESSFLFIAIVLFVVFIGYSGVRQGNVFVQLVDNPDPGSPPENESLRYLKSGLKEEQSVEIQQSLTKLMENEKLFLNEDLSLPQLAGILNIHPNYLSQIINQKFGKNFYDFVNYYRIEEFKRLLTEAKNKNLTFFALAVDCGFNSKASFNNSFKKFTGVTPSEYLKSIQY